VTLGELPDNTALLICGHCFAGEREIRLVSFDQDGPQAVCDLDHSSDDAEGHAKLIAVSHLFSKGEDFEFLKDLKLGQRAWKSGPREWTIEQIPE